jgi:hypothetical protein
MGKYTYSRSNVALNTANDLITFIAAANRRARILSIEIQGMGTTGQAMEIVASRSTGGTTGGGALTPQRKSSDAPAAAVTANTTWAAQPTLDTGTPVRLGFNQNGSIYRWAAIRGDELEFRNAEQISIRPSIGTGNATITVETEEDF